MKKIISLILVSIFIFSVCIVSGYATPSNALWYSVDGKPLFQYVIGSFKVASSAYYYEDYENIPENDEDKALIIYGFSESFVDATQEFIVPDEIDCQKIENVVIHDYNFLKKVVLSDGIKRFSCNMSLSDRWESTWNTPREENPIESLHLGKDFLPDSLRWFAGNGRYDSLECITVSKENPNLTSYKDLVYSKDFKKVLFCPININKSVITLRKETKAIGENAFSHNKNIKRIKNIAKIKKIGMGAFSHTKKIKSFKNINQINHKLFYRSKIEKFVIGKKIKNIGGMAFYKSNLKEIVIPENVKEIGQEAFAYSKLKKGDFKSKY